MKTIMITGGLGFIGSNLVKYWRKHHPEDFVVVVDCMTYAARPEYIRDELESDVKCYNVDIRDHLAVGRLMAGVQPDLVFHLAAESHVCRSIAGPKDFVNTNIVGTFHLLEELKQIELVDPKNRLFVHVSTDEVFGELWADEAPFNEENRLKPRSPYAASKAASEHLVEAYRHTYGLRTIITNCSNNFGPNQHEEKLVPATIQRIAEGKPARLYGNGLQVRDWLWVEDHCSALDTIAHSGKVGERYCIGGETERTNKQVVEALALIMGVDTGVEHTDDRPTDDKRYAINCDKLKALGWAPSHKFEENLARTVQHYVSNYSRTGVGLERAEQRQGEANV